MRGGEFKFRIVKMHMKLRDQQLKTIMYVNRLLYKNLMVTTNQKCIINIYKKRKRNPNIKIKIVIKAQKK